MSRLNTRQVRLGKSATLSQNFIISTPAVPDGTMSIARESGTHVLDIDANGKVSFPGNVQTLTDVKTTPGRVAGTTYTNSTGQPIVVNATLQGTGAAGQALIAVVDGLTFYGSSTPGANLVASISMVVPNGKTYSLAMSPTTGQTVVSWVELR